MELVMSGYMLRMNNITDEENIWKRDILFVVGIDHNLSSDLEKQVKKIYQWPKKINEIVDEAEKQHREEWYVIEKTIILRKKEFDKVMEELS